MTPFQIEEHFAELNRQLQLISEAINNMRALIKQQNTPVYIIPAGLDLAKDLKNYKPGQIMKAKPVAWDIRGTKPHEDPTP